MSVFGVFYMYCIAEVWYHKDMDITHFGLGGERIGILH